MSMLTRKKALLRAGTVPDTEFGLSGSVQLAAQSTRVQNWTAIPRVIGLSSGNSRLHVERIAYAGDLIASIALNGVAGTLVIASPTHTSSGVSIYVWTDSTLPGTAGTYNLTVSTETTDGSVGHALGQTFFGARQAGWPNAAGGATAANTVQTSTSVLVNVGEWLLDVLRTDENDTINTYVPATKTIQLNATGPSPFTNTFAGAADDGLSGTVTSGWTLTTTSAALECAAIVVGPAA